MIDLEADLRDAADAADQRPVTQARYDAATGRIYLAMTPDGGARKVVFDVTGWTRNPADPAPGGMTAKGP